MRAKFVNEARISFNEWKEDVLTNLRNNPDRDPEYWDWFETTDQFKDILFNNWENFISARETAEEILRISVEN